MKYVLIQWLAVCFSLLQADFSVIKIFETFAFPVALAIVLMVLLTRSEKQKIEIMQKNAEKQIELMEKNNEYLKSLIANNKCNFK